MAASHLLSVAYYKLYKRYGVLPILLVLLLLNRLLHKVRLSSRIACVSLVRDPTLIMLLMLGELTLHTRVSTHYIHLLAEHTSAVHRLNLIMNGLVRGHALNRLLKS